MNRLTLAAVFGVWVTARVAAGDPRMSPYGIDSWDEVHRALFVRTSPADGAVRVHGIDPLLYRGGTFLLEGEAHRRAVAALDAFLTAPVAADGSPIQRFLLQRDLWAAFDYVAWYPDDWVHKSKHEPAAVALRGRLAQAIARLALGPEQVAALPDNYARAVTSGEFAPAHDPSHPGRPFLPADLFDGRGPWVRYHTISATPMAKEHFDAAGGRAAHVIFLRLPGGRAATEAFLGTLRDGWPKDVQFPPGTTVAMVRRAVAIDAGTKLRATPVTERVQLRVYRRIPGTPDANMGGDFGEQDAYEFVLDRAKLSAGGHGLRAVGRDEPTEPFARNEGDPFTPGGQERRVAGRQMDSCIQCHQAPGLRSVLSMARHRVDANRRGETFRTYGLDVELNYTRHAKAKRYEWGLLQGLIEGEQK